MPDLWPWLALAGAGALHGLNPANGWMLAAAWGLRSRDRRELLRALWPIAAGHAASVGLAVVLILGGPGLGRAALQLVAAVLLVLGVGLHALRRPAWTTRLPAGRAGLALAAFIGSSIHGAGLMLVPALMPFCVADAAVAGQGGGLGRLAAALAAVALHGAAMLGVTGLIAAGVRRGCLAWIAWLRDRVRRNPIAAR